MKRVGIGIAFFAVAFVAAQPARASKTCYANYLNVSGTTGTGDINVGSVSWPDRKAECLKKARENCGRADSWINGNRAAICAGGGRIRIDTTVSGLRKSRDGFCSRVLNCP